MRQDFRVSFDHFILGTSDIYFPLFYLGNTAVNAIRRRELAQKRARKLIVIMIGQTITRNMI